MSSAKTGPGLVHRFGQIALVVCLLTLPVEAWAAFTFTKGDGDKQVRLDLGGFVQLEMRGGDGQSAEGGLEFEAQRIRVGLNYYRGPIAGKLLFDFNQSFTSREAGLPMAVKDAFVAYKFSNAAFVRMGMIKTPVGMTFTTPAWNLDIIDRDLLDKGLVLERDIGVMLSGRLIGQERHTDREQLNVSGVELGAERQGYGFGYDIGVFNPAGRSAAVVWDENLVGDALAYAGRLHYDRGPGLHVETSYGVSEQAGGMVMDGPTTEDYEVFGLGIASELWETGLEFKGEYLSGSDIQGEKGWDQATYSLTVGYYVLDNLELVVKAYRAESERDALKTDLGNTYVGFNFYLAPSSSAWRDLQQNKIVVNYIFTNADEETWNGIGGYRDDAWGVQWQYRF
jgi:hypothetical protein